MRRVPDDADLSKYDLTGLTVAPAVSNDVLIPDMATARTRQRAIINAARSAAINSGLPTSFGLFQTDLESRVEISGAVQLAREAQDAGLPFSVSYRRADNTDAELTGPQMRQMGVEIGLQVNAIHMRSRVLKQRIDAATTLAEIAAVGWSLED